MTKILSRALICVVGLLEITPRLAGQNILYAEHNGQMFPVRRVQNYRAMVEVDGKLVVALGQTFGLKKCDEYLPALITLRNVTGISGYKSIFGRPNQMNGSFEFDADVESAYSLENVFLVLVLAFKDKSEAIFLCDVGRLEAYRSVPIKRFMSTAQVLGSGHFEIHLFAGGQEVLNSQQPFDYRESMLDRMVAKRVAGVRDASAKPFCGPAPQIPRRLATTETDATASVRFRIRTNGSVLDPVIINASNPDFADASVSALRQWRFLPKMKNGVPVETEAEKSFEFKSPK